MALSGKIGAVFMQTADAPVSFSEEATTGSLDDRRFTISGAAKRYWDKETPVTVKVNSVVKNNQRLVTINVPSVAAGLSSHLQSGDIVTVAVFLEQTSDGEDSSPQVILYPELKGLEVYSVENNRTRDTAQVFLMANVSGCLQIYKPPLL